MIDSIISGWWQVLALLAGLIVGIWALVFAVVFFIARARKSGVDEISAGPVKLDFEDKDK